MFKRLTFVVVAGLVAAPAWLLLAEDKPAAEADKPAATQPGGDAFKSEKERVSYSIGMRIASGMKAQEVDLDIDVIAKAMKDVMAGNKTLLTEPEAQQVLMQWQGRMQEEFQKKQAALAQKSQAEGAKFLEENKKKEGVKTTPSGLQYKVIASGEGASPKADDTVTVHYKGTLTSGEQFDSSLDRGEPATFMVNRVIPGWTEALQLMKVGDKWQVYIPSDLAYGPRGNGRNIPPNSVLVFDVELLGIQPPATQPAASATTPPKP
jgi:FKBP-type peptidyl-prolyl cis-trans isomerase FklB